MQSSCSDMRDRAESEYRRSFIMAMR